MKLNLQTRSVLLIAWILFFAISLNTAILTYIAHNRYKQTILSKVGSAGEAMKEEIAKVLSLGLSLENIEGLNEKMKRAVLDSTVDYAMILNMKGRILFHSDEGDVGKVFKDAATLNALSAGGNLVQKWGDFYDIVSPLQDAEGKNVGILRIGVESGVIQKELYTLIFWAAILSALSFLLFSAVIYFSVSKFITGPIMNMEKVATRISAGDLTQTVKKAGKDEIASLAEAINSMGLNLRDMLFKIKNLAENVSSVTATITESPASVLRVGELQKTAIEQNAVSIEELNVSVSSIALSSESLYESVEKAASAVEEMTASISAVSESARSFNDASHKTASSIDEMISSLKNTARSVEFLSASSEESASALDQVNATVREIQVSAEKSVVLAENVSREASEKGLTTVNMAITGMEDIRGSVNAISEKINLLGKRSEEIGSIVNVIDDLSQQTNLLALNASILAAQAGEHGRAFAVIADENKMLAERTSSSTREIAALISAVQEETRASVEMASKGIKTVDAGVQLVSKVREAFHSIFKSANVATDMSRSIQQATTEEVKVIIQITDSIRQISEQIGQISRATKEQSRGADFIVEAAENVASGSEQIKRSAEEQFQSNKQMLSVYENVSEQTGQINSSINNQKQKSSEIVMNMEKIRKTTSDLIYSATEMDRSISSLSKDARTLLAELQKFSV
ncbi:MAG: methyl-accepting chemotaxis protein [Thermodesulfovibrionales bacterium]|nr:methyl-accepting chemotaxis protein [Thermodesulfovibrionales bacterium]